MIDGEAPLGAGEVGTMEHPSATHFMSNIPETMKRRGIVIEQDKDGISYCEGDLLHSVADPAGVSLAPYIHALSGVARQVLAGKAGPRRVLMIGCGGGPLATMLVRAGVAVTLVDNDPS